MDKSYRRDAMSRYRKNNYKYKQYRPGTGNKRKPSIATKLLAQILISIIIVLLIIMLKSFNTPITNETSLFIRRIMYADFDYKDSLDKTKEYASKLRDYTIKTVPIFNNLGNNLNLSKPVDGIIISSYGEKYDPVTNNQTFQRGIDIKATDLKIVKSIKDGVVEQVGESDSLGKFVKIYHGESTFSLYSNLEKAYVKESEKIIRGQRIGEVGNLQNSYLHFELWINDDAVDPELYIDYSITGI
ncbi:peptidoglycan DD-metalloendopeptidase family protein [Wukongibacter sp. M2B1]|uniref:peptidoglycan DD-metalloendopeptidase family protein n=1 Tax=Wukongibacter sp. M2B1 TaxID=3088895 RepID=UPI003D7B9D17